MLKCGIRERCISVRIIDGVESWSFMHSNWGLHENTSEVKRYADIGDEILRGQKVEKYHEPSNRQLR